MAEIVLRDVTHSYAEPPAAGGGDVLEAIELTVDDGDIHVLLGAAGSGKTTLLHIVSGLLRPRRGQVLFDGRDVTARGAAARNVAQVFGQPVVYDTMTVAQNLAFPLRNRGVRHPDAERRVAELLELLELKPLASARASALPAEQQQRVALGRALVRDDVAAVLLDEALTELDPASRRQLRRKLQAAHQRFARTMIYATHDPEEASALADRIAVVHAGKILQVGTPQALFEAPAHLYVARFVGAPGMNVMGAHLVADGIGIDGTEIVLGGHWATAARQHARARLAIGIRPEFLGVSATPRDDAVPARLAAVQDVGRFKLVRARLGPHEVTAKLPADQPVPTDEAHLVFDPDGTRLYADDRLVA